MSNPYYHGSEEWHAYESGLRDVAVRVAAGFVCGPDVNEDHLQMLAEAYIAGIRYARSGATPSNDLD